MGPGATDLPSLYSTIGVAVRSTQWLPHGWHLKGAVIIGVTYDPVNSQGKGCLRPISATPFHSDSHLGERDYCLEGEKSCVPLIEQVNSKNHLVKLSAVGF